MTVRAAVNYPGVVSITIFNAGPADLRSDDFAGEAPAAGAAGDGGSVVELRGYWRQILVPSCI